MVRNSSKSRYMAQGLYMETDKNGRHHLVLKYERKKMTGDYSLAGR